MPYREPAENEEAKHDAAELQALATGLGRTRRRGFVLAGVAGLIGLTALGGVLVVARRGSTDEAPCDVTEAYELASPSEMSELTKEKAASELSGKAATHLRIMTNERRAHYSDVRIARWRSPHLDKKKQVYWIIEELHVESQVHWLRIYQPDGNVAAVASRWDTNERYTFMVPDHCWSCVKLGSELGGDGID